MTMVPYLGFLVAGLPTYGLRARLWLFLSLKLNSPSVRPHPLQMEPDLCSLTLSHFQDLTATTFLFSFPIFSYHILCFFLVHLKLILSVSFSPLTMFSTLSTYLNFTCPSWPSSSTWNLPWSPRWKRSFPPLNSYDNLRRHLSWALSLTTQSTNF